MDQKNDAKKDAGKYLTRLFFQRVIGAALFFTAAGTFRDLRGAANLSLYFALSIIGGIIMYTKYPETLSERGKKREGAKVWDIILVLVIWLSVYHFVYIIAGLGVRFGWSRLPMGWFYAGVVLYIVSSVFTSWPVFENKYFEETARIQGDRAQTVIATGPYAIVRHPGYAGIVIWAVASALMFGTLAAGITALVVIAAVCVRTYLEDKMLKEELAGYLEYSEKVRFRLLPFIW